MVDHIPELFVAELIERQAGNKPRYHLLVGFQKDRLVLFNFLEVFLVERESIIRICRRSKRVGQVPVDRIVVESADIDLADQMPVVVQRLILVTLLNTEARKINLT